jgi:pSer/pThr/pTyr-binding forkhead associated (FHA) protein
MTDRQAASPGTDPVAPHSMTPRELKALLATERGAIPFVAYRNEAGALRTFVLTGSDRPLVVGRREGVDLRLGWDREISGIHAELRCVGGEWTIVDDGLSTNGTFLNERRVTARQRLRDGDRVRVGRTILAFNAAASGPVDKTSMAHDYPDVGQLSDTQRRILIALCRPQLTGGELHAPATNHQIAGEVYLGVDAVKMQLRSLFVKYGLNDLPQNQKRAGLAELALRVGLVTRRDI